MIPEGIEILQGDPKGFENMAGWLELCCKINDPHGYGCGFAGLCHNLFNQKDRAWKWAGGDLTKQAEKQVAATRFRQTESDWLDASSPTLNLRSPTILDMIDGRW